MKRSPDSHPEVPSQQGTGEARLAAVPAIGQHMLRGSIWMVAMRWCMRGIGLVSTVIIARLLMPEDLGIVAMAMIVVMFFEALTYVGVDLAVIQRPEASRAFYDSAWTLKFAQAVAVALVLALLAPAAADFFNEPRVVPVIWVLALGGAVGGLENIGIVAFRKELDFAREFRFGVYKKLLSFAAVVVFVVILQNYWALVLGTLAGRGLGVLLSYGMHPYRPSLSLAKISAIWGFSQWLLIYQLGRFLSRRIDEFIIGRVAGTGSMGEYHVAADAATSATAELVMPIGRAMFPAYARIADSSAELASAFLKTLAYVAMLCVPIGLGLSAVAEDFVLLLFGGQWTGAIPMFRWLTIYGVAAALSSATLPLFLALGRVRRSALLSWLHLLVLAPALLLPALNGSLADIAAMRAAVAALYVLLVLHSVTRVCPVTARDLLEVLWRPLLCGAVMWLAVGLLHDDGGAHRYLSLGIDVATGVAVFIGLILLTWVLSGRPQGVERTIMTPLASRLQALMVR